MTYGPPVHRWHGLPKGIRAVILAQKARRDAEKESTRALF